MHTLLKRILNEDRLAIPKEEYDEELIAAQFGTIDGETEDAWLVACSHRIKPPATFEQIRDAEARLGFRIPDDYRQFLAITDGANLFAAPGPSFPDPSIKNPYVRFALFGCEDLVRMNAILLWQFREVYSVEAEFEAATQLNYLAFCDAGDADFQALLRDANDHRVFLLFHEFTYRPYSLRDTEWYYDIAPSLESWFELILRTGGWGGRGSKGGL
jgi:hypothetical protein